MLYGWLQGHKTVQGACITHKYGESELNWKMAATRPDDASPTATLAGATGGARAVRD